MFTRENVLLGCYQHPHVIISYKLVEGDGFYRLEQGLHQNTFSFGVSQCYHLSICYRPAATLARWLLVDTFKNVFRYCVNV